jgi:hypothetical protein
MPYRAKPARWLRLSASLVLAFLFVYALALFLFKFTSGFAWDFSINWTGAWALREGIPLYDRPALQSLAVLHIDSGMKNLFNGPFQSFISLPTTAMLLLPFTWLPYDQAEHIYRLCSLLALFIGALLTALSLPSRQRFYGIIAGLFLVVLWQPAQSSIHLGQMDSWVVLALGSAFFGLSRQRYTLVGVSIGFATLLKISPALLLAYFILKQQWRVVIAAGGVLFVTALLCLLPHDGSDMQTFFSQIVPVLSEGTLHVQNQSLGALLARLAADGNGPFPFNAKPGIWQWISLGITLMLSLILFRMKRSAYVSAEEMACLTLLALLSGSISWDHYFTWAIPPVLLCFARNPYTVLLAGPFLVGSFWPMGDYTLSCLLLAGFLLFERGECIRQIFRPDNTHITQ